jgi:hypothetical protein
MPVVMTPTPSLIVYTRPDCGLCREALATIDALLAVRRAEGRQVPPVVERDITTDPGWERAFSDRIPVVDFAGRRLELVTSPARLRRLLADVLDTSTHRRPTEAASPGG